MDLYDVIREEASKTYTDETQLDAFMDGFEKQAIDMAGPGFRYGRAAAGAAKAAGSAGRSGIWQGLGDFIRSPAGHQALAEGGIKTAFGIGAGLLGAGVYQGLHHSSTALRSNALTSKFEASLQYVKNNNKIVKNANPSKVASYANTLFTFAPHVASDPNILNSLLANAVLGEGIDPMTIKSITDLEGRYKENISPDPLVGIRS